MDFSKIYELIKKDDPTIKDYVNSENINENLPETMSQIPRFLRFSPPLIAVAAYYGSVNAYKCMVDLGADVSAIDSFSTPVSFFSVIGENREILDDLLSKGQDFNGSVFLAIEHHKLDSIKWLMEKDLIQRHSTDSRGYSIGLYAVLSKNEQIMDFVFNDLNEIPKVDATGDNILLYLLNNGLKEQVRAVVNRYPSLANKPGKDGVTPVRLAQLKKYEDMEEILCQKVHPKYPKVKSKEKHAVNNDDSDEKDSKSICCLII